MKSCRWMLNLDLTVAARELSQCAWNVEPHFEDLLLMLLEAPLGRRFTRGEGRCERVRTIGEEGPSATVQRTQRIEGKPSAIFSHERPSSRDAKSWPLRVPK